MNWENLIHGLALFVLAEFNLNANFFERVALSPG
jgi:hypothetical protein